MSEQPREHAGVWMDRLARVMARVAQDADRRGVLDALARGLVDEFDAALARIWLYDPREHVMRVHVTAGDVRDYSGSSERIPLTAAHWPIARALLNREVVVIEEIGPESGIRDLAWAQREGLRSFAGFPLVMGDRLIGAMVVYRRLPLEPLVCDALTLLSHQAALALEHARVLDESHGLQEVVAALASAQDTDALAETIVRRTADALGADAGAIWLLDEAAAALLPTAVHGLSERFLEQVIDAGDRIVQIAFTDMRSSGAPIFSEDAPRDARPRDPGLADALEAEGICSILRLPLFAPGGQITGMLVLYHRHARAYSASEIRFAQSFADQIAVALEHTRRAAQERRARETATRQLDRLTALMQITQQLLVAGEQDRVLHVVLEAVERISPEATGMIALIDADWRHLTIAAAHGPLATILRTIFPQTELDAAYLDGTAIGRALASGETVVVEDYTTWSVPSETRERSLAAGVRAFVAAPLKVGARVIGLLWVGDTTARSFAPEDVVLVEALADQAALAIEHTSLLLRSQEAAVLEERARLARDLHDSVTQSIFSLSMLTSAAQAQHARGMPALATTLERAGRLAQEALTEMRALIFELRPEALETEGLAEALEKLVSAVRVRTDVPISYQAASVTRLPPDIETAIFRIVQESLGNAVKHAGATAIAVSLREADASLTVCITDDGDGFDPALAPPERRQGGMGLRSMRERAAAAGLSLTIDSTPGHGTSVTVAAAHHPPARP